jgi:uncharacterized protein YndB with AHSA1/START domain
MSTVHAEIEIDAPLQRVWETVMNPHRLRDWVTIHRAVRHVSDEPLSRGSTMEQTLHIHGLPFRVHWTLTHLSAPHSAEWEGHGPAHSRARIQYKLSGSDGGPTTFEYTNEFTTPGGRLGNAASKLVVGATSERETHASLARLKKLVERG